MYGEFTHILLRNLEHTENSYRFLVATLSLKSLFWTSHDTFLKSFAMHQVFLLKYVLEL